MYRDSSAAPLLDLRRRLKAVMDVPDVMFRGAVSLAHSVELSVQWDGMCPIRRGFPPWVGELVA